MNDKHDNTFLAAICCHWDYDASGSSHAVHNIWVQQAVYTWVLFCLGSGKGRLTGSYQRVDERKTRTQVTMTTALLTVTITSLSALLTVTKTNYKLFVYHRNQVKYKKEKAKSQYCVHAENETKTVQKNYGKF